MANNVFVTGTDTEVGKTYVATRLMRAIRAHGKAVVGFKPVASGARLESGVLKNEDAVQLMAENSIVAPYSLINPYCFEPAIAPHIAAEQVNEVIDLSTIQSCYQQLSESADVVVVEGAGGWLTPMGEGRFFDDMPCELALDVVLVVGLKLGCINHALLTQIAVKQSGCRLVGWVANEIEPNYLTLEKTITTLEKERQVPCLGRVSHQAKGDESGAKSDLDVTVLLGD